MNGIDCATRLTSASAQALKSSGVEVVGRYLGRTFWNGLTLDEVKAIQNANLALFLIFELNPTKKSYFTRAKGISDAQAAITEAEYLGAPQGTTIYFTVDYDAQSSDMEAIIEYFGGVRDGLEGKYLVGAYGSYTVMQVLDSSANAPDHYFQTYAWSGKNVFVNNHIYQYQNEVTIAGVALDRDQVNENAGLWEVEDVLETAVVLYTEADKEAGFKVAARNENCAIFVRNSDHSAPKEALKAKKLFVIGGSSLNHSNETLLTGNSWAGTAYAVGKYLGIE